MKMMKQMRAPPVFSILFKTLFLRILVSSIVCEECFMFTGSVPQCILFCKRSSPDSYGMLAEEAEIRPV